MCVCVSFVINTLSLRFNLFQNPDALLLCLFLEASYYDMIYFRDIFFRLRILHDVYYINLI